MILNCYVDDRTLAILQRIANETGRTVEDLAESAIAETVLDAQRKEPTR